MGQTSKFTSLVVGFQRGTSSAHHDKPTYDIKPNQSQKRAQGKPVELLVSLIPAVVGDRSNHVVGSINRYPGQALQAPI